MEAPILQVFPPEEAPLLAAREIMKYLDEFGLVLPVEHYNESVDTITTLNYDDIVAILESIIRHQFGLESHDEAPGVVLVPPTSA